MTAPKYRELADMLLERIGSSAIGAPVPSERQLADETGVSRMTARRAIDELVRQGLLTREVGRGTFVSRPAVSMPLQLTSFTEDMRARGHEPSSTVLRLETVAADAAEAAIFGMAPGDPVLVLVRLRLADGTPMAIERTHLRADAFPGLERYDFAADSLYRVLLEEYDVRFDAGEQVIRAGIVHDDDAATLRLAAGAPVLELIRTSESQGVVVERTVSTYSAARFELSAQLAPITARGSAPRSALRVRG
ncbi:GntR family transcriptional regulator [Microbacterium imperiale]|uniref:HTH-type transcriptional repressor DasR n=1 Tax=Microbacterium imperiale TaxID=33884 RepID=A0A9W6HGA7_9MICO|nr:GntR family transcriptional regulator [Microbacterium imperiale]MBP2420513.1 GntR family transcriptional regulator [Microbacterium imperiale]MDS0200541.1 GntR family transcriptional regulator [Microbacterium imperiale]BFE40854.1 GntR family transcriptional regulator [Microbacterium imperiale]GLJ79970.1 HTH-type transcriptional repressor DasR [Microbacterium imperiale]